MRTRKAASILLTTVLYLITAPAVANTYGSVEPIANPAVIDTGPLRDQSLDVREVFAERLIECGVIDDVVQVLSSSGAISTVNQLNTSFDIVAGGFAGNTNPAYGYTVIDNGPNAASIDDIKVLTDSLGYVFSQGSAFLLDADNTGSFDFPANYVVMIFPEVPSIEGSAAFFELVGSIDPEIFETDTSGYTQYGNAYLSLQSFVPDEQFIAGYVQAGAIAGVEYTPIVDGEPSLFTGGAGFPGNDWMRILSSAFIPRLHAYTDFTVKFSKGLRDQCMLSQARDNPSRGEKRIANELLLKLGVQILPRTVRKYMPKHPRGQPRGDQRWSTFVRNHASAILACDFCVVVTATFQLLCVLVVALLLRHGLQRFENLLHAPLQKRAQT